MISHMLFRGVPVLALVIALLGGIAATGGTSDASACGKRLVMVPIEITEAGPLQSMFCGYHPVTQAEIHATCASHYWVTPAHNQCRSGGENFCCRNVVKEQRYHLGTCVVPGVCTHGVLAAPPDGEKVPTYTVSSLLPCSDSTPHEDCGEFVEEPEQD
jgi:hypothetical protein